MKIGFSTKNNLENKKTTSPGRAHVRDTWFGSHGEVAITVPCVGVHDFMRRSARDNPSCTNLDVFTIFRLFFLLAMS